MCHIQRSCVSLIQESCHRCCSVLQCVAVCCSVLHLEEACVLVLECVGVCWSVLECAEVCCSVLQCVAWCGSVLQCVAVRCSALWCVEMLCSALQCVAVRCSALQCVAVRCSALQCVAACYRRGNAQPPTSAGGLHDHSQKYSSTCLYSCAISGTDTRGGPLSIANGPSNECSAAPCCVACLIHMCHVPYSYA